MSINKKVIENYCNTGKLKQNKISEKLKSLDNNAKYYATSISKEAGNELRIKEVELENRCDDSFNSNKIVVLYDRIDFLECQSILDFEGLKDFIYKKKDRLKN